MKIFFALLAFSLSLFISVKAQDVSEVQWFENLFKTRSTKKSIDEEKLAINKKKVEAAKADNQRNEARALIELAVFHLEVLKEYEPAMDWLIQSMKLVDIDSSYLKKEKVFTLIALSRVFEKVGNLNKSSKFLNEANNLTPDSDYELNILIYSELGRVNSNQNNLPEAYQNYLDMLKSARNIAAREKEGDALFQLGNLLTKQKEYDEALDTHRDALTIWREIHNRSKEAKSLNDIGALYLLRKNTERALANHIAALQIQKSLNDNAGLAESYNNLGALYLAKKDFKKAIEYLNLALSDIRDDQELALNTYELLSQSYKALGDFKNALKHHENQLSTLNHIQNEKTESELLEKENNYILSGKEVKIGTLQTINDEKQRKLDDEKKLKRFLYLIIALGTIIGFLVLYLYFSKQKSNRKLKELNDTKDKLFSIIGHDLKGPLNSLTAFSSLLIHHSETLSKDEIKMLSADVDKSLKNLFSLLENLLEWARSQTGNISFEAESFNLALLFKENTDLLKELAQKKKINIINEGGTNLPVKAHRHSINTVVRNLISNAIKFTPEGGKITLSSKQLGTFLQITVADTGVGLNEKTKKKLFKLGTKVSTLGTSQEKGTGLGLILCKDFVEKNGGIIGVESIEGKGSRFFFTIPSA